MLIEQKTKIGYLVANDGDCISLSLDQRTRLTEVESKVGNPLHCRPLVTLGCY